MSESGDCEIASVDFKGDVAEETTDVTCKTMFEEFQPIRETEQYQNAKYPENTIVGNKGWTADQFAKQIGLAVGSVALHYGNANVLVRESPNNKVFSLQVYKKGELVLVPVTKKVKIDDLSKYTGGAIDYCVWTCGGDVPDGYAFTLMPTSASELATPAFFVKASEEATEVNMKVVMKEVDIHTLVVTKPAKAMKSTPPSQVAIPLLINTKAVKYGDELHYLKPAKIESKSKKRPFDVI
jgi:hypothetical protein